MSQATTTPSLKPPSVAPAPFDDAEADVILRTSDRVDFHVFSQILIASSSFFRGMFKIPQPPLQQQDVKDGKPVISVAEESGAWDIVLRICYPILTPKLGTLVAIELGLRVALKFEMVLPIAVLTTALEKFSFGSPLEVWVISCRLRLEKLALNAAKHIPRGTFDLPLDSELVGVSADDYFRLWKHFNAQASGSVLPTGFRLLSPSPPAVKNPPEELPLSVPFTLPRHCSPPDLICQSRDGTNFPVHSAILSLASESFGACSATTS